MRALVVYDSQFGNTQKIADSIARSLGARAVNVRDVVSSDIDGVDLLVVGSPTHAGMYTIPIQQFLNTFTRHSLDGVLVAAFDTRFDEPDLGFWSTLRIKHIGYAAPKIARELRAKGGTLVVPAEGFVVGNTQGPLASGEVERALQWLLGVTHNHR